MAVILSVLAPEGYQDKEYADSRKALEEAGHTVLTASTVSMAEGKFGGSVEVDVLLDDADVADYDAVLFVGGPGVEEYFDDPRALDLAQDFYNEGKLTTAICAAPSILANAGLLEDKKATCWEGESENLEGQGADYSGKDVEQDGLIITASGPSAATDFGKAIAEALKN